MSGDLKAQQAREQRERVRALQRRLNALGHDAGPEDGIYGRRTKTACDRAMTDGPDTKLTLADFVASAERLSVPVSRIRAIDAVESAGDGFNSDGKPVLLFEPHRFSRATQRRFDATHPFVSYPQWDRRKYPSTQTMRYGQLLVAVGLDVDAGFASASYGRFQILGENFAACGFADPFEFANAMAQDEQRQLLAFEMFLEAKGLLPALRRGDWAAVAKGYNGTAYKLNRYDERLAAADRNFGGVA